MSDDPIWIKNVRDGLRFTQSEMANAMGLSLRAYQDIESGASKLRGLDVLAAERVSLKHAIQLNNPMAATSTVRKDALELSRMIRGD